MPIHFCVVRVCSHSVVAGLSSCNGDPVACKAENIYYLAIYRTSWPTLDEMVRQLVQSQGAILGCALSP